MINMIGPAHPSFEGQCGKGSPDDFNLFAQTIVGLSGYARTGKDEVAKILVEDYGFKRFAFADKLRDCLYALNPVVVTNDYPFAFSTLRLQDVIEDYGWDGYKSSEFGTEIRTLLQRMGTEVGRNLLSDNIWVNELDKHYGRIVVTDMRFPNEYDKIKSLGGVTCRISRPGITAINAHISETAIDDKEFDTYIDNDRSLEDLSKVVHHWADIQGF